MKGRFNPIANLILLATAVAAFATLVTAGPWAAVPILGAGVYSSLSTPGRRWSRWRTTSRP